jgi:hypothetical protein
MSGYGMAARGAKLPLVDSLGWQSAASRSVTTDFRNKSANSKLSGGATLDMGVLMASLRLKHPRSGWRKAVIRRFGRTFSGLSDLSSRLVRC